MKPGNFLENEGKKSYKDGDQSKDLSFEYECNFDESDDMVDVIVDKVEADTINIDGFEKLITDLTIKDIWGLVFDTESHEKDIGSTLIGTIGKGSIWQLLVSIARLGLISFITIGRGRYHKVGFTSKDLQNHISKTRRGKVKDGDALVALAYLLSKADSNPLFLGKFTLKDSKLDNLVWADGASVVDYECFGDVLAFYTTYKKNVYNKPLVIFSRTNHHGQTTIFGCALLLDERSDTFKWALKKFLKFMFGKLPRCVLIDGDHAMRDAILEGIYNDKMKWAMTYLRERFFGRIRTTSQCEGIHSLLKNYVDSKTSLLEFIHKFSEVLRHYRNNHLAADFYTFYKFPVLTTCLESFEKQEAELYIRNIFKHVKDEIEATCALNVTECPNSRDIVEYNTSNYRKISSELLKLISKVQKKSDAQSRLSPTSTLIGDLTVVKSKSAPRKVLKGQKRRGCSHSTPKIRANSKKGQQKTEDITVTQETLKENTNTPGIEVSEVAGAATTKKLGLPQYPMHHYPVGHPYQPYVEVLLIPFHPV
ncbi:hypothetical protein Ahy_A03g013874 [Arachis hypogaea]|uniref:MULE transposase domain-containing protein n=1 Tax=Arachis hypogaea TaxID=3818 RepID=A0A445DWG1_ARAHY|nr:hypothetical protein Ahy_A03g013874 [Arachis hypogaea]